MDRWPTGFSLAVPLLLGACGSLSVLAENRVWEYTGAALMGLSAFIAPALMVSTLLKRAVADEDYAAALSMLTACFALGQILGPLLGGFVIERVGLEGGTASSGIILGIASVCATMYGVQQRLRITHASLSRTPGEEVAIETAELRAEALELHVGDRRAHRAAEGRRRDHAAVAGLARVALAVEERIAILDRLGEAANRAALDLVSPRFGSLADLLASFVGNVFVRHRLFPQ